MDLGLNRLNVGKRIGEADRASGNRSGDEEKRNSQRGATAFIHSGFTGEGGGELCGRAFVLYARRIGFGVSQDIAGRIDDSGAGSGGLAFLRGNFRERVSVVGFDTTGEEQSFLGEVTFNLGAQRGFPGAAQDEIHGEGGGGDDEQEDRQQLEENAVLHVYAFLIWGLGCRMRRNWEESRNPRPSRKECD